MTKANGAGQPPHPDIYKGQKVVEIILDSGEVVYVKTLSIYLRQGIRSKAEKIYPYPDKAAYERPVDPEKAAIPGMMHPAEDNPDYRRAVAEVDARRMEYHFEQLVNLACEWPAGKGVLIAKYADKLETLAEAIDIEGDNWEATWKYCIMGFEGDRTAIIQAASGNLMLTEGEVRDAMRIFRPVVSGARSADDN